MNQKCITVLIPCYASENYLRTTVDNIKAAIVNNPGEKYDYQIILVNDCSPDNTFETIRQLCQEDSHIIGIDLKENQGQTKARMIGYKYINGDYVVFMDDDGQHSPKWVFSLISKLNEGYDVVYAQFPVIKESFGRRLASKITDIILTLSSGKPRGLRITSYIAMNHVGIKAVKSMKMQYPLIFQSVAPYTKKIGRIEVEHQKRTEGKSRYTLKKLLKMWRGIVFQKKIAVPDDEQVIKEILNN